MGLNRTGLKFRGRLKIEDGQTFLGQILDPPDTSRVSNFLSARRYLRTSLKTPVSPRDVVISASAKYIVAEHADGFFKEEIYKHFKLFKVDSKQQWYTRTKVTHPVTGQVEETFKYEGEVSVAVEPKSNMEDRTNIPIAQHELIINKQVCIGDRLGQDWLVTKVSNQLGIVIVRVKES